MKGYRQQGGAELQTGFFPHLLCLASFFLGGILLGQVLARRVSPETGTELTRYLTDYLRLGEQSASPKTVWETVLVYARYPVLAAFLGFTSLGVLLLPGVTAVFGCFLSFSVCCFTATFGGGGILLALAVFGLRCAVTLPCYFLLAVRAWESSAALLRLSFGGVPRTTPPAAANSRWTRAAAVVLILLAGVCVELLLSPMLLRAVAERLL